MHTFLATIFTALFSFCHASSIRHANVDTAALQRAEVAYNFQNAPTRRERAQAQFRMQGHGGYAEAECLSCRKMNAVYYTR